MIKAKNYQEQPKKILQCAYCDSVFSAPRKVIAHTVSLHEKELNDFYKRMDDVEGKTAT